MEKQTIEATSTFISPEERARLVQFCARVTKNIDAAEDLAQETLLEAWWNEHTLRDPERRVPWLFGIVRNICLRWLRTHGRDTTHLIQPHPGQDTFLTNLEDVLVDDLDVEVALERKELIELLDRALSLLPPETRAVLIQRYVQESPLAEIAAHLGANASAVAMRLQRGKLILRRILTNEMSQDIAPYTVHASTGGWEITPLWCHFCGQQRLLGKRDPGEGKLLLKCPVCSPGVDEVLNRNHLSVLKGIRGYKRLYSRLAAWCDRYYRTGLRYGSITCPGCGRTIPASINSPANLPGWIRDNKYMQMWMRDSDDRLVIVPCEHCVSVCITSLESLVLESTEGQHFLQAHPRIRTLPRQYIENDGHASILTRFESVTDNARLDVISDYETYEMLHIYGCTL